MIPFIGDTEENLHRIFQSSKEAGAEFIIVGGLTLRPGRNKNEFFYTIEKNFADLLPKFRKLYGNNHRGGQPDPMVASELGIIDIVKTGYMLSKEYGITFYEPRFIPQGQNKKNLQISTALSRIAFLKEKIFYEYEGISEIHKAASYVETMQENLELMNENSLNNLPFNQQITDIIFEILFSNSCSYLESHNDWRNLLYN